MESFRIIKRALKYKSPADKHVEKLFIEELEEYNVVDKDKIIEIIKENYDEVVLVKSLELFREDRNGEMLKMYLGLK